jgi:hypothetical protein
MTEETEKKKKKDVNKAEMIRMCIECNMRRSEYGGYCRSCNPIKPAKKKKDDDES